MQIVSAGLGYSAQVTHGSYLRRNLTACQQQQTPVCKALLVQSWGQDRLAGLHQSRCHFLGVPCPAVWCCDTGSRTQVPNVVAVEHPVPHDVRSAASDCVIGGDFSWWVLRQKPLQRQLQAAILALMQMWIQSVRHSLIVTDIFTVDSTRWTLQLSEIRGPLPPDSVQGEHGMWDFVPDAHLPGRLL